MVGPITEALDLRAGSPAPDSAACPKWQRRPEARPREILDAAVAAFAADGYEGATIADVARRAGVSAGLVVHYYRSKADLFAAVIDDRFVGFVAGEEAMLAAHSGSCRDLLERLVRRLWEHLWQPGMIELGLLVKAERAEFPEAIRTLFQQLGERWRRLFETVLEAGAERGEFRWSGPHAARVIGPMIVGVVESSRCFGSLDRRPSSPDELWAALVSLLDRGVLSHQGESQ
jgi:AcrR family transcriptional regulator